MRKTLLPRKMVGQWILLVFLIWTFCLVNEGYSKFFVTRWGSLVPGNGNFKQPIGVAVDLSGHILVVDSGNHRILRFNSNTGDYIDQWASLGSVDGQLKRPYGLAIDSTGNNPCGGRIQPSHSEI